VWFHSDFFDFTGNFITFVGCKVLMDTTRQALVYQLNKVQNAVAESLVPWFTANMPVSYFRQVCFACSAYFDFCWVRSNSA
jgi:hypothetical protein